MNGSLLHPSLRVRYIIAVIAGSMMAVSFPKIGIAGLAWVAPGLMLAAALRSRGSESFRIGYIAGLTHYLASLSWLLNIPYRWHGIPVGPAAGWLALGAFLALFPATWVWLMTHFQPSKSSGLDDGDSLLSSVPERHATPGFGVESPSWLTRVTWTLSGAAAWVGMEMFIARVFSGFPWDLLGVSQYRMIPLIQIAAVTGVYGVSFVVVWTSLSLLAAAMTILRRPTVRSAWAPDIILPAMCVLVLFVAGFHRSNQRNVTDNAQLVEGRRPLRVTFVQPSIPQTLIWDESKDDERFAELLRLSRDALTNETDLLVWPEAAVPGLFRYDPKMLEPITELARSNHVWMIIGADDAEPKPGAETLKGAKFFNSSFLIGPDGTLREIYRKRGLVIFGEYVPLARWLPFMKYLTPIDSGFTAGDGPVPFRLSDLDIETSVLICFEDTFPHLARLSVRENTDFLINITNDGWFGEGSAQWQQAATAIFRAVENGVPLLRCANTGLTCWVDPFGRIREILRDAEGTVYGPGIMTVVLPGRLHYDTFYNTHGDVFGWVCVGWAVLLLVRKLLSLRPRKERVIY